MEEISYSGANQPSKKRISKRVALFGIFFVIILLLLGSVAYFVTSGKAPEEDSASITLEESTDEVIEEEEPTEEPLETEAPSPTKAPTKVPTRAASSEDTPASSGSVAVQNGSGESGVAGAAADVIKAAGFTIASTGNADNFDYTDVTIQVKNSKKSILADLEKALSAKYTVGDTSTDLSESTNYDALVIIGK